MKKLHPLIHAVAGRDLPTFVCSGDPNDDMYDYGKRKEFVPYQVVWVIGGSGDTGFAGWRWVDPFYQFRPLSDFDA